MSLPVRERGLKSKCSEQYISIFYVAPRAGAWIEISSTSHLTCISQSLPVRERGLKSYLLSLLPVTEIVAPRAGAWIEI